MTNNHLCWKCPNVITLDNSTGKLKITCSKYNFEFESVTERDFYRYKDKTDDIIGIDADNFVNSICSNCQYNTENTSCNIFKEKCKLDILKYKN
jgi:hypothetical protein